MKRGFSLNQIYSPRDNQRFVVRSPLVSEQVWLAAAETTLDTLVLVVPPQVSSLLLAPITVVVSCSWPLASLWRHPENQPWIGLRKSARKVVRNCLKKL